jgi:sulfatase modifying factor 1
MKPRALIPVVAVLFAAFSIATSRAQPLVTIDTVTVGDAGSVADTTVMTTDEGTSGYGAVGYEFNIGKYEVTIGQYATFLNSVAATDTYNLWDASLTSNLNIAGISRSGSSGSYSYAIIGSGDRPVTYVSWFDAARFANWLHNGATNGASTETGAYTLNGTNAGIITKNPGATWWIPSEDEWYKAAYYKGGGTNAGYWAYPTQSDTAPGNTIGGAANQANIIAEGSYSVTQSDNYDGSQNYLTGIGAFSNSGSAYGTFDQGGNVWEWNDAVVLGFGSYRGVRGGSWNYAAVELQPSSRYAIDPGPDGENDIGFRLATVPEPSTYALLAMTGVGALWWVRRRR